MKERKEFEVTKGTGKNKTVQYFTAESEDDLKKLGMFVWFGWSVKEIKK